MEVNVSGPYIYFTIPIFGGIDITQTTVSSLVVTALLMAAGILLGRKLQKRPGKLQVLVEKGVAMMQDMVVETMGPHNAHWMPYICTIFLCSICGSLIGMTGFLRSTTADLSTTLTWALMTTAIIWYQSIKHNGFLGWLKGFTEPIIPMTPMNIISEIAQPISMAFRHFGNVAGGGVVTSILYVALSGVSAALLNLIASNGVVVGIAVLLTGAVLIAVSLRARKKKLLWRIPGIALAVIGGLGILQALDVLSGVPILAFGIPAVLSVYFDLFSGFIQAFVFSLLSMVYISNACPPPREESAPAEPAA